MGMASANTLMGVAAGASVVELSALGIGERNGIGDLFLVGRHLQEKGFDLNLKTEREDLFREYYEYVDTVYFEQTGLHLLDYRTPFFGEGVRTHVAGTHGATDYGVLKEGDYYLNVLCGKHLVRKFLARHSISCDPSHLPQLVEQVKTASVEVGRSLTPEEVRTLLKEPMSSIE
jgi:2-isopropylmalate synthase